MMEKICILLSTYNGEKYLNDQLQSIIEQNCNQEIIIYIRDDGSSDQTLQIIDNFMKHNPDLNISLVRGENVGVQKSFLSLLENAPEADYYAFCDQDDVWKNNKFDQAVKVLGNTNVPRLFYSSYEVVDENLNLKIKVDIPKTLAFKSITQIVFHNKVPGCTMVFNRALLLEIRKIHPDSIRMHDSFVCLIAYLTGEVFYTNDSLILYRQHSSNVLGYNKHTRASIRFKKMLNLFFHGESFRTGDVAKAILNSDFILTSAQCEELRVISDFRENWKYRIKLLKNPDTNSKNRRAALSIRFKVLFGLF